MDGVEAQRWVTGSRRLDVGLFIFILLLIVLQSPRLRVYFGTTVVEVSIEEIQPNGARRPLNTPDTFMRLGAGYWKGDSLVERLTPLISAHMEQSDWVREAPPGTRYEWTVRSSEDSMKLDRVDRIVWEAAANEATDR